MASRILGWLLAMGMYVGPIPVAWAAPGQHDAGLVLEVETASRTYLPGEPILVAIQYRNEGPSAFEDLSLTDPRQGRLQFKLSRGTEEITWTGPEELWLFSDEGVSLPAGQSYCDVFDLLDYFGRKRAEVIAGKSIQLRRSLAPGTYTLETAAMARLRVRRDLPQVVLRANAIQFQIAGAESVPESERDAVDELTVQEGNRIPPRSLEHWRTIEEGRLRFSRYLPEIVRRSLPSSDSADVVELVIAARKSGASVIQGAGLLKYRMSAYGSRLQEARDWLKRTSADPRLIEFDCYLRGWDAVMGALVRRASRR